MSRRVTAISWVQRVVLAVAVVAIVGFGVRATGTAVAKLNVATGSLWLASPANGSVVQANPSSREPTASIVVSPRSGELLEVLQQGPSAVVLNRSSGEIGRIDGVSLTWDLGRTFSSASADLHLAGNAESGSLYLHDAAQGLIGRLDPTLLTLLSEAKIQPGRSALEVDKDSTLWTFDPQSGDVLTIRKNGTSRRQHLVGSASGATLTLVDGEPYLADPDRGRVMALSMKTAKPGDQRCFDADNVTDALITGSDSTSQNRQVFVVSPGDGVLHTSDLDRNQCVRLQISSTEDTVSSAGVSNEYGQPVAHDDVVFIPLLTKGKVMVVDAIRNRVERLVTVTPPGKQFELVLNDGVVWFNNLAGADAGTLDRDGIVTTIRKYESRSAGVGDGEGSAAGLTFSADGESPVDTAPGGATVATTPRDKTASPPTTARATQGEGSQGAVPGRRSLLEDLIDKTDSSSEGAANSTAAKSDPLNNTNSPVAPLEKGDETPPPSPSPNVTPPPGVTVNPGDANQAGDRSKSPPTNPAAPADQNVSPRLPTPTTTPPPAPPSSTLVARIATSSAIVEVGQTLSLVDRSLGGPTQWLWNFGDEETDVRQNPTHVYGKAGRYLVTLQVSTGPNQARATVTIEVREKAAEQRPVAQFTLDASTVEVDAVVQFTDRSVGKITAWEWDFGDNTKSNASTKVSHAWSSPGIYTVALTVRNEFGATVSQRSVAVVAVVAAPRASFDWSPNRPSVGQTILFRSTSSGNPTESRWEFSTEQSALGETVARRFDEPGTYEVGLRVTNGKGSDRVVQTVTISPAFGPPTASFNLGSQSTESNVPVQFTSTSSGVVSRIVWDFGDNTSSTNASVQHAWSRPGRYSVTLTAFNDAGSSQAGPVVVTVNAPSYRPVNAAFVSRPGARLDDAAEPGSPVSFVDRSTGSPTSWNWDFGDGTSDTRQNPSHVYAKPGTYTVRLKVTDGQSSDQATKEVYVRGTPTVLGPVADFTIAPAKPLAGQSVSFTDRSANSPTQWRWDFADRTANSSQQNPTHVFDRPGAYAVNLVALNSAGASNKSIVVEVAAVPKQPPAADFVIVTPPGERFVGRPITFRAVVSGAVSTPVFIFAQNEQVTADSTNTATRTFTSAGVHTVGMSVCWADDRTNCTTRTKTLTVAASVALPQVSFSIRGPGVVDQQTANAGTAITFTDTSTGETLQSWKWVIGNQTREGREVTVTVDAPGDVAISLTVTNSAGSQQGSRVLKIIAATPLDAAFIASNAGAAVTTGTTVTFTDRSTGNPTAWLWNFGDGTAPSAGPTASHSFAAPGRYTVILTASHATGSDTAQVDISVVAPAGPKPRIQAIGATLTPGQNNGPFTATLGSDIRFFDAAAGTAGNSTLTWSWEFSDGGTGSTSSTRHVFTKTGPVTITVTATDRLGQSGTDTFQIVIVAAAPVAPTPAAPTPAAPQANPPI